jgi:hypothetical protein
MNLIDRYLREVKLGLPKAQQDDIIKELSDDLYSQIEDKEAGLGRPLTEDEQVALLKKYGHPMILASRYRRRQHLIGPTLLPIYLKVLKVALGIGLLVFVVAGIATAASGQTFSSSLGVLFRYFNVALIIFANITIIFVLLDLFGVHFHLGERWDPRTLPAPRKDGKSKPQVESIATLIAQAIFGIWWLTGLHYPFLVFGPGVAFFRFAPVWLAIYPLFVALLLVDVTRTATLIVRPDWIQFRLVARLAIRLMNLAVLYFLIKAPELFVASTGAPQAQEVVKSLNYGLHMGLAVAAVVVGVLWVVDVVKLVGTFLGQTAKAIAGS